MSHDFNNHAVATDLVSCHKCGKSIKNTVQNCTYCAAPQSGVMPNTNVNAKGNASGAQSSSSKGCLIAIIVVLFLGVAGVGILAAIAIPAYQDYVARAKTNEAYQYLQKLTYDVDEYMEQHDASFPQRIEDLQLSAHSAQANFSVKFNTLEKSMNVQFSEISSLKDKRLSMFLAVSKDEMQQTTFEWHCASRDIADKLLPHDCRKYASTVHKD